MKSKSSVAVSCFIPGRAKDLSAPLYFATFVIYYILIKEKYMEQFSSETMANRGKTMQLAQCWLTKIDRAQHMGLIICYD